MDQKKSKLDEHLDYLNLHCIRENYQSASRGAAQKKLSYLDFLSELIEEEANCRYQRSLERRVKNAHFPFLKTLGQFDWSHPQKINQQQIQHLCRLDFIEKKENAIFCSTVGLGKTHLTIAIGYIACTKGYSVLFATAADIINSLSVAQRTNRFTQELKKYTSPKCLCIDELGYLTIDRHGADLLFQVISNRYERGSIILTTNRIFKDWAVMFNNDSSLTSAVLDRLIHHSEVILIEGKSYRMKDKL